MKSLTHSDLPISDDTIIGNYVWIRQNAVILPSVHIGDGVIFGANCVVDSNVEPVTPGKCIVEAHLGCTEY